MSFALKIKVHTWSRFKLLRPFIKSQTRDQIRRV